MNSHVLLAFFLVLFALSGCNSNAEEASGASDTIKAKIESKQAIPSATAQPEAFTSENQVLTRARSIKARLSAYSKSYLDLADVYVLTFHVGSKETKVTSLQAIKISSKLNASQTIFTFTKPKNYLILYSYDAAAKHANEMRIPTDSLKVGQFTDFPVLDEKTGKMNLTRIELLKIQHK